MEVFGQLDAPGALPPDKDPPLLVGQEAMWSPESVWTRWQREGTPSLQLLFTKLLSDKFLRGYLISLPYFRRFLLNKLWTNQWHSVPGRLNFPIIFSHDGERQRRSGLDNPGKELACNSSPRKKRWRKWRKPHLEVQEGTTLWWKHTGVLKEHSPRELSVM